jgi:CopA family copper-resistance protein
MDGVPGLTFRGILPGETFTYRFPVVQTGTYWYHSHSGMQEQTGLYGALILEAAVPDPAAPVRDHVILLSDWTDEDPMDVVANLKQEGDYYSTDRPSLAGLVRDARADGAGTALRDRLRWEGMRMSPNDIADVTGATYTFLVNGQPPAGNFTALFEPGERVRLRFINASSMTIFDVRIPGLALTMIAADGSDIDPVTVDAFRIGVAETYDTVVTPLVAAAYTIFAQAEDRSGYARATLAPRHGMAAFVPAMDARPVRTMADMGMAMGGMKMAGMGVPRHLPAPADDGMKDMAGMDMSGMDHARATPPPVHLAGKPDVDNVAADPTDRLAEAGDGLPVAGRRTLTYADLKSRAARPFVPPSRDIVFHLTGNMERWVWGFDGKKFSEVGPVRVALWERVRFVLINDTMMEHPIHLHGFLFELENGQDGNLPLKHTVNVKPGERTSFVFTADTAGHWAFHCHLLYHMETGMFRTILVA